MLGLNATLLHILHMSQCKSFIRACMYLSDIKNECCVCKKYKEDDYKKKEKKRNK